MFCPVEYLGDIIIYPHELSGITLALGGAAPILKNKIISFKLTNCKCTDEFGEWLRGFADAEGYFFIQTTSRKEKKLSGKIVNYRRAIFSFILHLHIKDNNVLYNIQKLLGDIGTVKSYDKHKAAFLIISKKEDTDKLLEFMHSYFCRLNTSKVLDYLGWYEARSIYYKFLDSRNKDVPLYEDPLYPSILDKVVGIKNSINKCRVDFTLPQDHKVIITDEWLLGFLEGEGCFYINGVSVAFKLAQTRVNRYVLEGIKNYLHHKYGDKMVITLIDCKANKLKAKPHTELFIGKSNHTAHNLISFLIDLSWLSIKVLDFINWTIIYILVYEGKHLLPQGKEIIAKLKSRSGMALSNATDLLNGQLISKQVLELLNSESNYVDSDQPGIWKVKSNYKNLPSKIHKQGSYVLAMTKENTKILRFKSNAECAKYFEVSKTYLGRWMNKNTHISTKKGVFLFTKQYEKVDT